MTQDIRQWLAEIQSLQQKLTEAQQERDDAQKSEANWRNLYETEARQRRTEAKLVQQKITALQAELNVLKADASPVNSANSPGADPDRLQRVQQQISELDSIEALQNRLRKALLEHDQLKQALRSEQTAHQHTRLELTAALGDAIDYLQGGSASHRLTQERARNSSKPEDIALSEPPVVLPPVKSPSLELPQFE